MTMSLIEIKELVNQLAEKIGAPQNFLPTYGNAAQGDGVYIEVDSNGYHWIGAERGMEIERYSTADLDDFLYKIFESVTFDLSCQYELAHRIGGQDCRRIIFKHQAELLFMLSPTWSERNKQEHDQILVKYPMHDPGTL